MKTKKKKKKRTAMCYVEILHKWVTVKEAVQLSLGQDKQDKLFVHPIIVDLLAEFIEKKQGNPQLIWEDEHTCVWDGLLDFLICEGINPQKYIQIGPGCKTAGIPLKYVQPAYELYRTKHPHKVSKLEQLVSNGESEQQIQRDKLFGHSITAILRWMGTDSWDYQEAKIALTALNVCPADNTIRIQLRAGKMGERGDPADLDSEQISVLYDALSDDKS